jgi:type I restriction enzyme, S subunit
MFLNDISIDWIGKVPIGWEIKRVKHLFFLKKEVSENPTDEKILSLTFGGIVVRDVSSNEGQLPETYNGYTKIYPNDIVMNPMDLRSGWVDKSMYEGIISPSYYVLNTGVDIVNIGYFNYQLQRHYKERIFFPFGQGVSYDYRWGMGRETLLNFPMLLPPQKTQSGIVSFLDNKTQKIDQLIDLTEKKIKLLKEQRTSLINHCVTKGLNPNVEMKDSGVEWIGEIPSHWKFIPLKYCTGNQGGIQTGPFGTQLNTKDYVEQGVKVMNQKTLIKENYSLGEEYISYEKYESLKGFDVLEGDIIMGTRGSFGGDNRTTFGKCSIVPSGLGDCVLHPCLIRIRLTPSFVNKSYFYFYVNDSSYFLEEIRHTSNSTTIEVIYGVTLKDVRFPIPPINEQEEITSHIKKETTKIDLDIKREKKRINLLKEYRQSLISEVVTGKIDVRDWKE